MNKNDFRHLLNKEEKKKCLILGGAPSISAIDFEKFDGILISMGDTPIKIKKIRKPDYWVSANHIFPLPDKHYDILNQYGQTTFVFASSVSNSYLSTDYQKVDKHLKIPWFEYDQRHFNGLDCNKHIDHRFAFDKPLNCCQYKKDITIQEYLKNIYKLDSHYSTGSTAAIHSLALAIILGCNEIYIGGVDLPLLQKDKKYYSTETTIKLIKHLFFKELSRKYRTISLGMVFNSIFKLNQKSEYYPDLPVILQDFEYLNNLCNSNGIKLFNLSPKSTLNKIYNFNHLDPKAFNNSLIILMALVQYI